jgi:hypothetical protein
MHLRIRYHAFSDADRVVQAGESFAALCRFDGQVSIKGSHLSVSQRESHWL